MDTKKHSGSASTRKVSRKDGRYLEETIASVAAPKVSCHKSRKEKTSRSPLRATTLENNIKKSSRVEFREPVASFRDATGRSSSYLTSSQLETQHLLSDLNRSDLHNSDERLSRMIYERDTRDLQSQEFELGHSCSVNDTVVRFLNDHEAISALQNTEALSQYERTKERTSEGYKGSEEHSAIHFPNSLYNKEQKGLHPSETSQSSTLSPVSLRLENLKRRQPDAKLEKLKERIRKQCEQSEELAEKGRTYAVEQPLATNLETAVPTTKVRKVANAPPAPTYKGFNPVETKVRTPDGKVWHEHEYQSISRELCSDLMLKSSESGKTKEKSEKSSMKKTSKPLRKVQKMTHLDSLDHGTSSHVINTSSWREGQKLVKKVLGPSPKLQEKRAQSTDRTGRERDVKPGQTRAESDTRVQACRRSRAQSSERPYSRVHSEGNLMKASSATLNEKAEDGNTVSKDFLPAEIQGILSDLQLDTLGQISKQDLEQVQETDKVLAARVSRSRSPTKRKSEKLNPNEELHAISKRRHYDADVVRQYIVRQQEERKKKQNEEKKAQQEASELKQRRLQELYKKQKEAFNKAKTASEVTVSKGLQETYSKFLLRQSRFDDLSDHLPLSEDSQKRPGYQPSGESDKENKGQDRPTSASSSSDLSLSEPLQPLTRNDLMELTWMQPDRLSPAGVSMQKQPSDMARANHCSELNLKKGKDSAECKPAVVAWEKGVGRQLPLQSQHSMSQQGLMKNTNQYRNQLDRIEALKATAASLSNRIESEAKKLAGAGVHCGAFLSSEHDVLHTFVDSVKWAKPLSPPVHDEEDVFSAKIRKMLGVHVAQSCDDVFPGVGSVHEFKNETEHMKSLVPRMSGVEGREVEPDKTPLPTLDVPVQQHDKLYEKVVNFKSQDSSSGSISEGPLLSEESLSEDDRVHVMSNPVKVPECLKIKEFCAEESNTFKPINEFQKQSEKYSPFPSHSSLQSKAPWEELTKGSPYSVINIFTKNYQVLQKGHVEKSERCSPILHPLLPAVSPVNSYEDDFVSSQESVSSLALKTSLQEASSASSIISIHEELPNRKSVYELCPSERRSPHSPGSRSAGSSSSSSSRRSRNVEGLETGVLSAEHVQRKEDRFTESTEHSSQDGRQGEPSSSSRNNERGLIMDSKLDVCSGHSLTRSPSDNGKLKKMPTSPSSSHSSVSHSPLQSEMFVDASAAVNVTDKSKPPASMPVPVSAFSGFCSSDAFVSLNVQPNQTSHTISTGSMKFAPAILQHRMTAELNYLDAIEESVRQLSDIERTRGISLAQQESVSLAQILKAQQQRHERDLALLKMKAEQETLDTQRQLEETRQKAAEARAECLQQLVQTRQEAAEKLEETASKLVTQQAQAALLTADAARQIMEMTELARSQMKPVNAPAASITSLFDDQRKQHTDFMKQLQMRTEKESTHNSSQRESPSLLSLDKIENRSHQAENTGISSEEMVHTAANSSLRSDSIPSLPDEKDSTSVATEYSLKFDESMTEDEIEQQSFRSLLPSESHRRLSMEKKQIQREDSDEDPSDEKTAISSVKEFTMPFSSGQDSFSRFTMEMVRQYMKEEEMRAAHHSSLLRLREKALKEKTKAELAWLDLQKKRLRDKGEDDKMPPIRKKQRGLLLKLRQEQAEIKRLKEANKAARKERQLILKQQEEIERMRQTTIKLQEKLKSAAEASLELNSLGSSEEHAKPSCTSSPVLTDLETRSTSPVSISGSETSSIMQKLKKMRTHMDEKFLTKREQKLMQRRRHAEELLEWRRRLDAEEAEVRRIEKQALAAWDKDRVKQKTSKKELGESSPDHKETVEESSPVPCHSQMNSESSIPEEMGSLPAETVVSEVINQGQSVSPDPSMCSEEAYSHEFESTSSPNKHSPSKTSTSTSKQKSKQENVNAGSQVKLLVNCRNTSGSWSDESLSLTHSETASDQSDIESRIRALREELKQRKAIAEQLKKEQKKRYKERLKAQEASLIKQLESYDEFIKKTQAELSRDLESSPTTKPMIKTPSSAVEKPKIKTAPLHRHETAKSRKSLTESEKSRSLLEPVTEHALTASEDLHTAPSKKYFGPEAISEEPSRSSFPVPKSQVRAVTEFADEPFHGDLPDSSKGTGLPVGKQDNVSGGESVVSSHRTGIQEELEHTKSEESELEDAYSQHSDKSEPLLKLSIVKLSPTNDVGNHSVLPKQSECEAKNEHLNEDNIDLKDSVFSIEDDAASELSVSSIRSVNSERSSDILSQKTLEKASIFSDAVLQHKELSDSEVNIFSPRKEESAYGTPHTETYKDGFELSSPRKEYSYSETFTEMQDHSLIKDETKQEHTEPRSPSPTTFEMIEHQCKKSLSSHESLHSERMVELRSPTELSKERERSDVEYQEQSFFMSVSRSPSPDVEYADTLMDFNIGDRVLVNGTQAGTLKFKGCVIFASGYWAGVELDKLEGSNNGTFDGIVYFHCKDNHGIFVSPHQLSHLPKSFETFVETTEDSFYDAKLVCQQKQDEKSNTDECEKNKVKQYVEGIWEGVSSEETETIFVEKSGKYSNLKENTILITESPEILKHAVEVSGVDSGTIQDENKLNELFSSVVEKVTSCILDESFDNLLNEELKKQQSLDNRSLEKKEKLPSLHDKSFTPLLDLLTKEKDHLDSQLKAAPAEAVEIFDDMLQEHEAVVEEDKVSLLTDRLLKVVLKDSIEQIQQIMKAHNEKIEIADRDLQTDFNDESIPRMPPKLLSFQDKVAGSLQSLLKTDQPDGEREKTSSPDVYPRPESPIFGTSGQEELAKRLAELELNQKVLSILGDDQSWFEDEFGLHSTSVRQQYKKEGQQRLQQVIDLPEVIPKPEEESVCVVPHTQAEVEALAVLAVEELWKWKELGHDLHGISASLDFLGEPSKCPDMESISKRVYKQAVFDLTKEIFQDIFTEDPNLGQPPWMKPCTVTPAYFRRVHNPSDLHEIKTFIAAEVLKLFGLRKEKNHKTEMQNMMKFGRKKRDRVDHILVQELHDEEVQWINYDEDELCVKMQLADGIFDALIKDTVNVLNQIQENQRQVAAV
ncbi:centrosome-associated protein 350 [Protopterus annectens]|uniref:centrosome-associated protein 350 n=1 Tax=Protopterus annectens TaxID=7888 RepID=UPI001CFA4AEF|nr:centrosome-associated protein 350 [Protopterus annectens]